MNNDVFILVILSALIQASWNFAAKRSTGNRSVLLLLGWFFQGLFLLPFAIYFTDFSNFSIEWVYLIISSSCIHTIYISLLGWGYAKGDISMVYPIARGIGITGTATLAILLYGEFVTFNGLLGIVSIIAGCVLIGSREIFRHDHRHAFLIAIAIGLCITLYSIIDSFAAKTIPVFLFMVALNIAPAVIAAPILLTFAKKDLIKICRYYKLESLLVTAGGTASYVLILLAYQKAPTSYVIALREVSIIFASVLGVFFLKERLYFRKKTAIFLIVLGIFVIKIAK